MPHQTESKKITKDVSAKIHTIMASIHQAFMQLKGTSLPDGQSLRKTYWIKSWSEIKQLSPNELDELNQAINSMQETLEKLKEKISSLRGKKIQARAERHSLENLNEWEEDEFLDSAAVLPVFSQKKPSGKRWVITQSLERPKTITQVCQAIWIVLTNRAITIVDGDKKNVPPSRDRDLMIEKHRIAALPNLLDDKTITDPLTGKPLMNLYPINIEVKETLLWMLSERAKKERMFCELYVKFLQEIIKKSKLYEWTSKYSQIANKILREIKDLT